MTPEEAMKRCQAGCTDLQMANNLLAACYGVIGALMGEVGMLKIQLNVAKRGMDSAKQAGALMMEKGQKLAAENSPDAIESEREANAVLTAEVKSLKKHNEFLNGELKRSRLDERQAMTYLSQVRIAAEHDGDFPSLVEHVKQMAEALRAAHEMTKAAWTEGSHAGWKLNERSTG